MAIGIKNKRISFFYIYVFLMIMWSSRTSPFWDLYSATSVMTIIYLCINLYFYIKFCKSKSLRPVWIFTSIVCVWYALVCLKFGKLIKFPYPIIYDIFVVFIAYCMMKKRFFYYFDKVVSDLSLICLVVWLGAVLLPDMVPILIHKISITPAARPMASNFFIFGLCSQFEEGIRRNLGFTWEPGRYSCYLLIALFINLSINKFKIYNNRNFWILFLSLLSTLSTTGYVGCSIVILYFLYNKGIMSKAIVIGILVVAFPTIMSFSFMQNKIQDVILTTYNEDEVSHNMNHIMSQKEMPIIVPQRGLGIYVDVLDFIHDPFIGYGEEFRSYSNTRLFHGYIVSSSNGITKIFASKGLIYGCIIYILLFASSFLFAWQWQTKGVFFLAILFLTISVSYDFWNGVWGFFVFYSLMYYNGIHFSFWREYKSLTLNNFIRHGNTSLSINRDKQQL